ncbi:FRG domain-containing protein [Rubrivivax albus]|uniref:FRG domain-containing protein n=1 Tax=Rubrivivax albus TaxID=2499835 RepID=A0A3S2UK68_9BURK|nr:FRG domain-containing protein [Rubrivivax albus]RVT47219.1 FRG domain-containing protein [Rubrivivax albus]
MNITEITKAEIKSPSDLMKWGGHLEGLNAKSGPMLFRGQPEPFSNLKPTLARAVDGGAYDAAILLERRLLKNFRTHYLDLQSLPPDMPTGEEVNARNDVEVLSLMQHYEVPSRLLDWSASVWVAAYFACASNPDKDAELWFVDEALMNPTPSELPTHEVQRLVLGSIGERPTDYHKKWGMPLIAVMVPMENARLKAQQGKLTASDNVTVDHAQLLSRLDALLHPEKKTGNSFGRFLIKGARKRDILRFLSEEKGVSAKSLFPDIVGLGRFLRWEFEALRTELY